MKNPPFTKNLMGIGDIIVNAAEELMSEYDLTKLEALIYIDAMLDAQIREAEHEEEKIK